MKQLKTSHPTFRKFNSESDAKQWLENPLVTPQRPEQIKQKYRSNQEKMTKKAYSMSKNLLFSSSLIKLKMSGDTESPLRVARSPYQPLGEVRIGSEPSQEWRNMIIHKIKENNTNMVNEVMEELMKQPYALISKVMGQFFSLHV